MNNPRSFRGFGVPLVHRPAIAALARQALARLPAATQWAVESYQRGVFAERAQPLDTFIWSSAGWAFVAAFEPVRAALRSLGPTVELRRGEPADVVPVRRAFLAWTDDAAEAAGFGSGPGGRLRRAQVPIGCILAVLPHGRGLEYLVTPGCPGLREAAPLAARPGLVEVGPQRPTGWGEPFWLDGAADRRRAEAAFRLYGATVRSWTPRSPDDDDYWSGYNPAPNHGYYRVNVPLAAVGPLTAALERAGLQLEI